MAKKMKKPKVKIGVSGLPYREQRYRSVETGEVINVRFYDCSDLPISKVEEK